MLEIGVHDQHPFPASALRAGHHRAAQAALPGAGRAAEQPDGQCGAGGALGERLRCFIVTVIDNQELGVRRVKRRGELLQQWPDVELLVASGDDDGQASRCRPAGGLVKDQHRGVVRGERGVSQQYVTIVPL